MELGIIVKIALNAWIERGLDRKHHGYIVENIARLLIDDAIRRVKRRMFVPFFWCHSFSMNFAYFLCPYFLPLCSCGRGALSCCPFASAFPNQAAISPW